MTKETNDSTAIISERGMEIINKLKRIREDFEETSDAEAWMEKEAWAHLQDFFLEEMQPLESELTEEIFDANNFETEQVKAD
tara:strand:+ start:1480 stop:1725 length:246 start_codon:yes stop_codon:yes gene_type:complete